MVKWKWRDRISFCNSSWEGHAYVYQISRRSIHTIQYQPHGGAGGEVKGSPKSVDFMLRGLMNVFTTFNGNPSSRRCDISVWTKMEDWQTVTKNAILLCHIYYTGKIVLGLLEFSPPARDQMNFSVASVWSVSTEKHMRRKVSHCITKSFHATLLKGGTTRMKSANRWR